MRERDEHPFLGREMAQPRTVSEATAKAVDEAARRILTEAEQRVEEVLRKHRSERLVDRLEKEATLDRPAIDACLGQSKSGARSKDAAASAA